MKTLLETLTNRLTSGNDIPVERVRLSNEEMVDISIFVCRGSVRSTDGKLGDIETDYNRLFNEVIISDGFAQADTLRPIVAWMEDQLPSTVRCGIPACRDVAYGDNPICKEHLESGYLTDYQEYRSLLSEGYTRLQASVMSGLSDPE